MNKDMTDLEKKVEERANILWELRYCGIRECKEIAKQTLIWELEARIGESNYLIKKWGTYAFLVTRKVDLQSELEELRK